MRILFLGEYIMKKQSWKPYVFWIVFTEAVGGLSGWLARDGMEIYQSSVKQPPLSPPSVVFPIAWAILYALMGIGAARIYLAPTSGKRSWALSVYLIQLAFNFFWTLIFFNLQAFMVALIWLIALWALILEMIFSFFPVDKWAAWLQIPYLLWVAFAAYLNYGVWVLNR